MLQNSRSASAFLPFALYIHKRQSSYILAALNGLIMGGWIVQLLL